MKPVVLPLLLLSMVACNSKTEKIHYPQAHKDDVSDDYFGVEVKDPYRWLEDDRSEQTAQWVKEQNGITFDYLDKIPFRHALKERLNELNNYPKYGSPFKKNGKYYFFKNDGLQPQSILYVQDSLEAEPQVLLDPNTLSDDGTVALSTLSFSKDGRFLAYSIARSGSDWNEIFVMDLATRELLPEHHIRWVKFSGISWHDDGFFYCAYDEPEAGRELSGKNEYQKVYYHSMTNRWQRDRLVFEDREHPLRTYSVGVTDDGRYVYLYETEGTSGNSLLVGNPNFHNPGFAELAPGFEHDYYVVGHVDGKLFVWTNWEAPNGRLMAVDMTQRNRNREAWQEIIPETKHVLESVTLIGGKLMAQYMQDVASHAYAYDLSGKRLYEVHLPGLGSIGGFSGSNDDSEAFYTFTSFTCPPAIYRFNADDNVSELFRRSEVDFVPDEYVSEQVFYTSKDGTKVPMFLTYKKGLTRDGSNPVMLYGYGGFNISLTPSFTPNRIPFLENGGIYAIANLRGGGEYGEAWHKAGTKMDKQNVFDDFIAAAEYLIEQQWTSPSRLAINGGSNGGLLVGACLTQRPDLFGAAVPEVGVLDMLRYHRFTIGWAWASDYGTSEDSREMFEYLKAYSPLHNLYRGMNYPPTLVMTADHDDRVVPAHSFKFAATLQEVNDGEHPTLIRIDSNAGHGAGRPIHKVIDAQTDMWSFVMFNLGMEPVFD